MVYLEKLSHFLVGDKGGGKRVLNILTENNNGGRGSKLVHFLVASFLNCPNKSHFFFKRMEIRTFDTQP